MLFFGKRVNGELVVVKGETKEAVSLKAMANFDRIAKTRKAEKPRDVVMTVSA